MAHQCNLVIQTTSTLILVYKDWKFACFHVYVL
jgi:hypothetical protein